MKYEITIEEMVSEVFEVEADDMKSAMEIAEKKYVSGEFVLEPGNLITKQMCGFCPETDEGTEWSSF